MSSIEDLLNAEDSEEEEECSLPNVHDLEHLLDSGDEHDQQDGGLFLDGHAEVHCAQTDDSVMSVEIYQPKSTSTAVKGDPTDLFGADEIDNLHEIENAGLRGNLNSLDKAIEREKEFLRAGKRDTVSALQSKRNSANLTNYSNLRCDEVSKVSEQLRRNSLYKQHGPGQVTSLAVSSSFLAVGTAKGLIILFDHTEEIRQVLGSNLPPSARPTSSVTSLDAPKPPFSGESGGEGMLVVGYASGEVALWNTTSGALLKVVADLHTCPISTVHVSEAVSDSLIVPVGADLNAGLHAVPAAAKSARKSGRDESAASGISRLVTSATGAHFGGTSLMVISSDRDGVMYRTRFSKAMWSSSYVAESDCLLDASTGRLAAVAALAPLVRAVDADGEVSGSPVAAVHCNYVTAHRSTRMLAINVGLTQTWVVQTHPKIKIVFKWEAPAEAASLALVAPTNTRPTSLDWTWIPDVAVPADAREVDGREGADWAPLLARCWGEVVQTLVLRTSASSAVAQGVPQQPAPASATSFGSALTSFISTTTVSSTGSVGSVSTNAKDPAGSIRYQSKFAECSRRAFSGQKVVSMRWASPRELVLLTVTDVLVLNAQLQTMEALSVSPSVSMELGLFFGRSREDETGAPASLSNSVVQIDVSERKVFVLLHERVVRIQTQSCFELAEKLIARAQWLEALALVINSLHRSSEIPAPVLVEVDRYIVRYAELSVRQYMAAPARGAQAAAQAVAGDNSSSTNLAAQARNHFHLVAGVCIEFCIACGREEVLFGAVYSVFRSAQYQHVFLEALEPFILSREIVTLPPGVIAEFCECALRSRRLPAIERCVAYFEVSNLDINFLTKFLYENRMYSAFLYVFSNGLSDFAGAFQVVFNFFVAGLECGWTMADAEKSTSDLSAVAYKLLLFLSFTFDGKMFPRGDPFDQPQPTAGVELLDLVTSAELRPMPPVFSHQSSANFASSSAGLGEYPYLCKLGLVDLDALLSTLQKGLRSLVGSQSDSATNKCTAKVLERLWGFCNRGAAHGKFYDHFLAEVADCTSVLPSSFLVELASAAGKMPADTLDCIENGMGKVAEHQTRIAGYGHCGSFRQALQAGDFWIASLLPASSATASAEREEVLKEQLFKHAAQHYLAKSSLTNHGDSEFVVFQYLELAFSVTEAVFPLSQRRIYESTLCDATLQVLVNLGRLDVARTQTLVRAHLSGNVTQIAEHVAQEPKLRCRLLDSLLFGSDELLSVRSSRLVNDFTPQVLQTYLSDLATLEPGRVLEFLRIFETHYPVDDCLLVCRQKGLSEAVSFLMERTGQTVDALVMLLKDFSARLRQARRDIDAQLRAELTAQAAAAKANVRVSGYDADRYVVSAVLSRQDGQKASAAMRLACYQSLRSLMDCAADLCARNGGSDGSAMWLMAFDHLLMERQSIRAGTVSSSGEVVVVLIGLMLQTLLGHMGAATTQVTPQEVIRRVTAQGNAAGIRLGEFKGIMLSMLAANAHELMLHECIARIVRGDLGILHRSKISQLRKYVHKESYSTSGGGGGFLSSSSILGELEVPAARRDSLVMEERRLLHRRTVPSRSYAKFFNDGDWPSSASAVLVPTGVPRAAEISAGEARRPGTLDRAAMYKAHR